jgi:hypothetical protein
MVCVWRIEEPSEIPRGVEAVLVIVTIPQALHHQTHLQGSAHDVVIFIHLTFSRHVNNQRA